MMTIIDIGNMLSTLEKFYTKEKLYAERSYETTLEIWETYLSGADPSEVAHAVYDHIALSAFPPKISDIMKLISEIHRGNQMTGMQAFFEIKKAMSDAFTGKKHYADAYNELPPLLRKVVGSGSQLRDWARLDPSQFETVIMPFIVKSYEKAADQEARYYALPEALQKAEKWRIEAPADDLSLPPAQKSIDEVIAESNRKAAEYRGELTAERIERNREKVAAFLEPLPKKTKQAEIDESDRVWNEESVAAVAQRLKEKVLNDAEM